MNTVRLDEAIAHRGLAATRSQAENLIKLGHVTVDGVTVRKPGAKVLHSTKIEINKDVQFVSRAALKLKSAAESFDINFKDKTALDIGISTGGFTDYMLKQGAKEVVGVDVGTNQLHPTLFGHPHIDIHEKTDIRDYTKPSDVQFDFITIDVSFISMREVLPVAIKLANSTTFIIAMLKPQFEAGDRLKHKGVIKNDTMRRKILKDFEVWAKGRAVIIDKKDSDVSGKKGNIERFYLLKLPQE